MDRAQGNDTLNSGDQVRYYNGSTGLLVKEQFDNCSRCHKSFEESCAQQFCDCLINDDVEVIKGEAVMINKIMKKYKNSCGWKITLQKNDLPTLHFVIFESSPFFKLAGELTVGQLCAFKAILKNDNRDSTSSRTKRNDENDNILLNVYHLRI